jgi:hypothetical protein
MNSLYAHIETAKHFSTPATPVQEEDASTKANFALKVAQHLVESKPKEEEKPCQLRAQPIPN